MKSLRPLAALAALALTAFASPLSGADPAATAAPLELRAPDGHLAVTLSVQGALTYRVAIDGVTILGDSHLGLRLHDGAELGRDVSLVAATRSTAATTWENPFGKRRTVRDRHEQLTLTLRENSAAGRTFDVVFRAFDDGVGFRYALPAPAAGQPSEVIVDEELTQFVFPTNNVCFAGDHTTIPPEEYDHRGGFAGSQEWEFLRKRLDDLAVETVTGLPLLTQTPAAWVAITEADLLDWSALWLAREPQVAGTSAVTLRARLAPRLDGAGLVKTTLPRATPWRVLLIAREPGRLVESDLVLNLSTPSQIADPSWIKPGLMAWDRWWPGIGKVDAATMKQFIQFASDMGWPYQLIDAGWYTDRRKPTANLTEPVPEVDLPELRRFAAEKGVRLWLWLYWTDVDQADLEKAFATYEQWGIAGVKIDFMDRDDQEMVNWYERVSRLAAKYHLMVNFHGAYKPTGLNRTWPNQITREGVLGNEYNKWSTRADALHRVTLPFTRFLAGPGDYTPGGFLNRTPAKFQTRVSPSQVQGTRAAELALFVVYDSPIACVCDHPDNLRGQPGIDFLRAVPTVWDETLVLSGVVAEHIVMARRSGADWFLGALNNGAPRVRTVKLDFLGAGKWQARWWRDARDANENAESLDIEDRIVTTADQLDLRLVPGGGAVLRFTQIK